MEFNLISMWAAMGLAAKAVVVLLFFMSVYVVAVSVERYWVLRQGDAGANALVTALRELIERQGMGGLGEARTLAKAYPRVPLATVVDAAASAYGKKDSSLDAIDVVLGMNRAVERSIERETSNLRRGLPGLASIAATAPFVGLFGTVVGIINAFESIAATGSGGLAAVSAGISEALVTTAFGLLVAIPAVALYNMLSSRVDSVVVDMNEVASELVESVLLSGRK